MTTPRHRTSLVVLVVLVAFVGAAACKKERPEPVATAAAEPAPPAGVSVAEFEGVITKVCTRLLECSGLGANPPGDKVEECLANNRRLAVDEFTRGVLYEANQAVVTACQSRPCAEYADCYMDALKAEEARQLGSSVPKVDVSPETRERFLQLVCDIAAENAGRVPDLNTATPTPKVKELNALIDQIGSAGAVADLMKEAIKRCSK
jgi:hypothetical protein